MGIIKCSILARVRNWGWFCEGGRGWHQDFTEVLSSWTLCFLKMLCTTSLTAAILLSISKQC